MNDKQLRILIVTQLTAGLTRAGITLPVIAGNQPTTQGREDQGIYFFPISDAASGWQSRTYSPNQLPTIPMEDTQHVETAFQVEALVMDDPASLASLTALDVLHTARMVIASLPFVQAMQDAGAGVQRPSNVRTPYFTNDRDQFEMSPSFDFTVSHKRAIIQSVNSIGSGEFDLFRI